MKKMKKWTALLCAAMMAVSLVALPPVETAHALSVAELQQQLNASKEKAEEYARQIAELETQKNAAIDQKLLLDQRNAVLQEQIDIVTMQVENTQLAIATYEQKEKEQYELFCKQVRQEEERGTVSYWSVLFKATGFADLLSRIDFINEVMEYNQRVIQDLRDIRNQLTVSRAALEAQKTELDATQAELQEQIDEANRVINDFIATQAGLEEMHAAEAAEAERMDQAIKDWIEANSSTSGGEHDGSTQGILNSIIWPSDYRYVTSKYGNRDQPTAGASTDHRGWDIGAPWGSNVYASHSGEIIQAGWNGGYGYSVTIYHGAGVSTLYAHMDDYYVSVGDWVAQGEVIGPCGTTGISTGPHIHYEIRVNGEKIDPMPYLPGYIPWWD